MPYTFWWYATLSYIATNMAVKIVTDILSIICIIKCVFILKTCGTLLLQFYPIMAVWCISAVTCCEYIDIIWEYVSGKIRTLYIDTTLLLARLCQWNFIYHTCVMKKFWHSLPHDEEGLIPQWREDLETLSVLLSLCEKNPPTKGQQCGFNVFFFVSLNKLVSRSFDDLTRHNAHAT